MLSRIMFALSLVGLGAAAATPALAEPITIEIRLGTRRPPARVVEVRTVAPGVGYVWISGYWDWQYSDWVWISGHWERRRPNVYWVPAAYVPVYGYVRYIPAHWSNQRVRESDEYVRWKADRRNHKGKGHGHEKHRH